VAIGTIHSYDVQNYNALGGIDDLADPNQGFAFRHTQQFCRPLVCGGCINFFAMRHIDRLHFPLPLPGRILFHTSNDQWNLAIQHQFWGDTTFQIGYVGQRATHLMVPFSYTQRELLPNSACGAPPCTAPSPFFDKNPTFYNTLSTVTGGTQSNGNMSHDSLQAVLQKPMGRGLQ
jgi:hypothetical protein